MCSIRLLVVCVLGGVGTLYDNWAVRSYAVNDVVYDGSDFWICEQAHDDDRAPPNASYWDGALDTDNTYDLPAANYPASGSRDRYRLAVYQEINSVKYMTGDITSVTCNITMDSRMLNLFCQ